MLLSELNDLVLRWQRDPGFATFDAVQQQVAAWQAAHNPALAAFWKRRGFDPTQPDRAVVPAVPTDVFRHVRLAANAAPVVRTFRTSGTTAGARGEHHRLSLDAYVAGAIAFFGDMTGLAPHSTRFIKLVFDSERVPDSSLSFMVQHLESAFGVGQAPALLGDDGVDLDAFDRALAEADRPVVIFGTAFGFADALDRWTPSRRLPAGSIVVETGGFKGRSREVPRDELYAWFVEALGAARERCLSEYSMSELSSQLYTRGIELGRPTSLYRAPHWLRVSAADPTTLAILPDGEEGLLRFDDLANTDSVVAIQTSDVGRVTPDGVVLIGRAPGAAPRGCSLAVEEVLAQRGNP